MEFEYMKKLQNGSDIRGVALKEGEREPNLTKKEATLLAKGFLIWLTSKTNKKPCDISISIGRDPRLTGQTLFDGLNAGLLPHCRKIMNAGLASTPAMFMSTIFDEYRADGAIMITASHLPYTRNGFKFFDKHGGLDKKDIAEIIDSAIRLGTGDITAEDVIGPSKNDTSHLIDIDLMDKYCEHLRSLIINGVSNNDTDNKKPLKGLKITVDAGNGSGGFYANDVLKPLGADISGSQFLDPDGTFPNHIPNPEDKQAMDSICAAVKANGSDFGLIFDTDVDRSAAVDGAGREISRNGIVAMASALVAEEHPGTVVVTDSVTSNQLTDFIENIGIKHLRFKRGYKNVINKSIELNNAGTESWLAIETSGHAALRENHFLDDGAYLATKIVIKACLLAKEGKTLADLIKSLKEPLEQKEVRMDIFCSDYASYGNRILNDLNDWVEQINDKSIALAKPNYEGVRINFSDGAGNGWCLLRKSLHDPLMPLNIESDITGGVKMISSTLKKFLSKYNDLDISKL